MRMMIGSRYRGSVTVFAALSFVMVASVLCSLVESARVVGARVMVAMAADMAMDRLFSNYEQELLEKYGVLLFDGAGGGDELDTEYLLREIEEGISYNLGKNVGLMPVKGHDFYGVTVDAVTVDQVIAAPDACGLIWRKMVNDYAAVNYSAELLEEIMGIEDIQSENEVVSQAVEYLDKCYETSNEVYSEYLSLIEHLDGVKTNSSGINFEKIKLRDNYVKRLRIENDSEVTPESISIGNELVYENVSEDLFDIKAFVDIFLSKYSEVLSGKSLDYEFVSDLGGILRSYINGLSNEITVCMQIIDRIRSGQAAYTDSIAAAVEYISSISSISLESLEGLKDELGEVKAQQEDIEKRLGDADAMYEILSNNLKIVNAAAEFCVSLDFFGNISFDYQEALNAYKVYEKLPEALQGYRTDGMYLDYEGLACREEDKSILGCIYDYAAGGIVKMVLPKGAEISKKSIGNMELADLYGKRGDRKLYIDDVALSALNEVLFNLYIGDNFECFTYNDGQGLLDYELEYILCGKSSDKENLASAIGYVAGIRLGCNLAYIYTDAVRKNEAYNIAFAALGFTGIIPAVKALEYVILAAWAVGETVVDIKLLLRGDNVPLIKKKEDWRLDLQNLIEGKLDVDSRDSENGETEGFNYNQYLSCALLFTDSQNKAYRTMAAVEMYMMDVGVDNFRLRNYIYGLDISVTYHVGNKKRQYTERCSCTY